MINPNNRPATKAAMAAEASEKSGSRDHDMNHIIDPQPIAKNTPIKAAVGKKGPNIGGGISIPKRQSKRYNGGAAVYGEMPRAGKCAYIFCNFSECVISI